MTDNPDLDTFRNDDGSTSYEGQQNAGTFERTTYSQPSPQQSWESYEAFRTRVDYGSWGNGE
jgi:hypothetical protein